ncbi:hypothetical protein JCM3766R1_003901 [Sporobolomyces carnicolor]
MSTASKSQTPAEVRSEDVLSAKTDLCLSNAIVTAGTGLAVGIVASAILFKRRPWPVFFGLGFGIGQGYQDCQRVFNPAAIPGYRIQGEEGKTSLAPGFVRVSLCAQAASPFTLNRSTSSAPAAAEASKKFEQTKEETKSKVSELVQQAKAKASQAAAKVEDKAVEVKDKVVAGEKKVEAKVDDLKDGKKWV